MRNLTLQNLMLGLRNLLDDRKEALELSNTGKVYAIRFAEKRAEIEALPETLTGGRPLAQQLAETDDTHDGFGEAIYHYTEAIRCLPSAPGALKESARRIRDALVPRLAVLREPYADEAAAATAKRERITTLKDDLAAMPVPFPAGGTVTAWATAFVNAGDHIDELLNDRSLVDASSTLPRQAQLTRSSTIGLLTRFRAALADEMDGDKSLPRDLDAQVFSYFDQLQAMREQNARAGKATSKDGDGDAGAKDATEG